MSNPSSHPDKIIKAKRCSSMSCIFFVSLSMPINCKVNYRIAEIFQPGPQYFAEIFQPGTIPLSISPLLRRLAAHPGKAGGFAAVAPVAARGGFRGYWREYQHDEEDYS